MPSPSRHHLFSRPLLLVLLVWLAVPTLRAQEPVIPDEWRDAVVAQSGPWKLVSCRPNWPKAIFPTCQCFYQRPSGEKIWFDISRRATPQQAAKDLEESLKGWRSDVRITRKLRKNQAGQTVGTYAILAGVKQSDEFFEHVEWVDGPLYFSAHVAVPPEIERDSPASLFKRFGGVAIAFADEYHPN